jgi:hypothetical protein
MVILLGAGATRGAFVNDRPPPPVDSDFFDIANQISEGVRSLSLVGSREMFSRYMAPSLGSGLSNTIEMLKLDWN